MRKIARLDSYAGWKDLSSDLMEEVNTLRDILLTHNLDVSAEYNKKEYTRYDVIRMHYTVLKDILSYPSRVAEALKGNDIDQATAEQQLSSLLQNTDQVLSELGLN